MDKQLIEKYRDINVDTSWWYQCVFDDWAEKLKEKGIVAEDFAFSGFWSQGDGASFRGAIEVLPFMKAHEFDHKYPATYYLAEHGLVHLKLYREASFYSHDNTVSLSSEVEEYNPYDLDDDLRSSVFETMMEESIKEWESFQADVLQECRSYMRLVYADLERDYYDLTSDEQVWETIQLNELNNQAA